MHGEGKMKAKAKKCTKVMQEDPSVHKVSHEFGYISSKLNKTTEF